jgi:hypothetical protein
MIYKQELRPVAEVMPDKLPYLRMYRPQPNFQTEIIGKTIFLEYYFRSRNYEYNFFKIKCEVIWNISHTPFFPYNFRQKNVQPIHA